MNAAVKAKSPGMKRICTSCGSRFYDLNKRPIICPSCGTEFTGDIKVKGRRGRLPADSKKEGISKENIVENEEEILEDGVEVVGLEDVEEGEDDSDDDSIELEDDDMDTIPDFEDDLEDDLEEEEPILEEDED